MFAEKHASVSSNSTEVAQECNVEKAAVAVELSFEEEESRIEEEERRLEEARMFEEEQIIFGEEEDERRFEKGDAVEEEKLAEDAVCEFASDTISTSTVKAEVNVTDERQINAVSTRP